MEPPLEISAAATTRCGHLCGASACIYRSCPRKPPGPPSQGICRQLQLMFSYLLQNVGALTYFCDVFVSVGTPLFLLLYFSNQAMR